MCLSVTSSSSQLKPKSCLECFAALRADSGALTCSLCASSTPSACLRARHSCVVQGPGALLTSWVHFLAQDLWVAKYLTGDASNKRIPRLVRLDCLVIS